jgi:hypothetical protein
MDDFAHRRARKRLVLSTLVLGALVWLNPAWAQTSSSALAEQLFIDGQTLMAHGRPSEACPKFSESQRIEPRLGTLLNLAACHEADGKLALSWSEFMDASVLAERAKRPDREAFAKEHIAALEKRLGRLRITAPVMSSSGHPPEIRLDGQVLSPVALGTALPMDPGHHTLEASADGKAPWKAVIESRAGTEARVEIPALADQPTASAPPVDGRPEPANPPEHGSPRRAAGLIVGGVGLAGVWVGSVFGLLAFSNESQARKVCPDAGCTTQKGVDLHDTARTQALVSTLGFAVGALLTATGVFLVLTVPRGRSPASAQLRVRFEPGGLRASF